MKNYYEILGVTNEATEAQVKAKYRDLARKYHPDVNPSHEGRFRDINEAYRVLSDSLKRADYDQGFELGEDRISKEEDSKDNKEKKQEINLKNISIAIGRVAFSVFIGVLIGLAFEFIVWYIGKNSAFAINFYPGVITGGVIGFLLGMDLNFDIEGYFGVGYLGRTYSFLRTFLYAITFAYVLGRSFLIIGQILNLKNQVVTGGIILGIVLGSAFGSDSEGFNKIQTKEGRKNLFYTMLRSVLVGFLGMIMAVIFGFVISYLTSIPLVFWFGLIGFCLGTIVGGISPSNLQAYASYASSSIKNTYVILLVIGGIVIGILLGFIFQDQIKEFLNFIR